MLLSGWQARRLKAWRSLKGPLNALYGGRREGRKLGAGSAGSLGTSQWWKERELNTTTAAPMWARCQPGAVLTWAHSPVCPAKGEPALAEARDAGANKMGANTSPPRPGFPPPLWGLASRAERAGRVLCWGDSLRGRGEALRRISRPGWGWGERARQGSQLRRLSDTGRCLRRSRQSSGRALCRGRAGTAAGSRSPHAWARPAGGPRRHHGNPAGLPASRRPHCARSVDAAVARDNSASRRRGCLVTAAAGRERWASPAAGCPGAWFSSGRRGAIPRPAPRPGGTRLCCSLQRHVSGLRPLLTPWAAVARRSECGKPALSGPKQLHWKSLSGTGMGAGCGGSLPQRGSEHPAGLAAARPGSWPSAWLPLRRSGCHWCEAWGLSRPHLHPSKDSPDPHRELSGRCGPGYDWGALTGQVRAGGQAGRLSSWGAALQAAPPGVSPPPCPPCRWARQSCHRHAGPCAWSCTGAGGGPGHPVPAGLEESYRDITTCLLPGSHHSWLRDFLAFLLSPVCAVI